MIADNGCHTHQECGLLPPALLRANLQTTDNKPSFLWAHLRSGGAERTSERANERAPQNGKMGIRKFFFLSPGEKHQFSWLKLSLHARVCTLTSILGSDLGVSSGRPGTCDGEMLHALLTLLSGGQNDA